MKLHQAEALRAAACHALQMLAHDFEGLGDNSEQLDAAELLLEALGDDGAPFADSVADHRASLEASGSYLDSDERAERDAEIEREFAEVMAAQSGGNVVSLIGRGDG